MALEPAQPHSCPAPTATQIGNPWDDTRPGLPAHQKNECCNNYSVISTRLCLFNHNRHPALSMTCSPTPRPKFRRVLANTYIDIRTIIPAQSVPRGTLYVQPWATRSAEVVDDEDLAGGHPCRVSSPGFAIELGRATRRQCN